MTWTCASCQFVNRVRQERRGHRTTCTECHTPRGAPARNVAYFAPPSQGAASHGFREREAPKVQTFPNGHPWA